MPEAQTATQKALSGVFVDKIFSWGAYHDNIVPTDEDENDEDEPATKSPSKTGRAAAMAIPSSNRYLGRGELWDMKSQDKAHFSSVKAILPVELKVCLVILFITVLHY